MRIVNWSEHRQQRDAVTTHIGDEVFDLGGSGHDVQLQADGRIVIASGNSVIRFLSDGRYDPSFSRPSTGDFIPAITVDASDRIYVIADNNGVLQQFSGQVRVRVLPSDTPVILERSSAIDSGWSALTAVPANAWGDYIVRDFPGTGSTFYRARPVQ